jgi:hypothetical protein
VHEEEYGLLSNAVYEEELLSDAVHEKYGLLSNAVHAGNELLFDAISER